MMRGNRQGNNAFLEDPTHEHQTPKDYLMNSGYCMVKIFPNNDSVKEETLKVLQDCLGEDDFLKFVEKALPTIMENGCYNVLLGLFNLLGNA